MQLLLKQLCRVCTRTIRAQRRLKSRVLKSESVLENRNKSDETPLQRLLDEASTYGEAETSAAEPELRWVTQPYAARPRASAERSERVTPREAVVLLFPGEGSQRVGMGRRLLQVPAARQLYELASSVVGWDVARVCTEGPAPELARRAAVAVLATALGAAERARAERPDALMRVRAAAGYALGELAALAWAGALPLERALRLAELRDAALPDVGATLEVRVAPDARLGAALRAACARAAELGVREPVCRVAAYLYPGRKLVAGDEEALRYLEERGAAWGVRAARRVAGGAAHTPLAAGAERAMRAALDACAAEVRAPRVAVYSCAEARAYRDAAHVRRGLARQPAAPLRWEQTLHALYARPRGESFPLTLALGPGAELRAQLRRVNARAWDGSLQVDA